jgi:molecular chaperone GrpE
VNPTHGNSAAGDAARRAGHDAAMPAGQPAARGAQDADASELTAQVTELTAGVAALTERIAELEDQRLRALAEADNARKRCAAQVSRAEAEARAAVARKWLPVIDNLDLALVHATAEPATIIEGVKAVRSQALDVLAGLGFPRRDDRGTRFDPTRHEAVASRPDPAAPADLVAEVIRPAYGEGDRQLRPAQVVVARPG